MAGEPLPGGVTVSGPGGSVRLADGELARLPAETLAVRFQTEHGTRQGRFSGPLLWAALERSGLLADDPPKSQERQVVAVRGADGYEVVLALAELSPAFEAKQVILADEQDGQALGPAHWRLVVPGDRRGGRSVHDVTSLTLLSPLH